MARLSVMTIIGTRPELIRLSRVMALLDSSVAHVMVHTGQNYDFELNEIFFRELGIRRPDHFLAIDTSSLGAVLGSILIAIEPILRRERPDAVLILGDTNSSIAGIMAKRLKIPLYHMEAGNRSFDANVPEEINRRIIDHVADFNLAYTEHARRNLLAEGLHPRRVYVTGSPMREVLDHYRPQIDASRVLEELNLEPRGYFIASLHREENVDNPRQLTSLLFALERLAAIYDRDVIVSTHPRTRNRVEALGRTIHPRVRYLKPLGFFDYNRLQLDSFCALSDSGTISEEAAMLRFPAVTIRNSMERPEAMDTGTIILSGTDSDSIVDCVALVIREWDAGMRPEVPADYHVANTAQRVVNLIVGTARLHANWSKLAIHEPSGEQPQGRGPSVRPFSLSSDAAPGALED